MDVASVRRQLIPIRKLQLYLRRAQRCGVLAWDWAGGIEHGYSGDDRISFLRDMAGLKRLRSRG